MFATFKSSAASVMGSSKLKEKQKQAAELASAKTIQDGFPTYELTSKRLQPLQAAFEAKILQQHREELRKLQDSHEQVNNTLKAIAVKEKETEEEKDKSNSLAAFREAQEKRKIAIEKQISQVEERLSQKKDLKFFILGCQGNAKKNQKKVAELMSEIALDPANKPDFILLLGDNFYDYGVHSPDDEMFQTHFEKIYGKRCLAIRDIPCFVILGNHDENIHKMHMGIKQGVEVGMNQVVHSYLDDPQVYASPTLDLDHLPKWNMPARAYSLRFADKEIFCIDSNTYAMDYLAAQQGDTSLTNQAVWLETKVKQAQAEGRKVMLALHHPLVTQGKRAFISDLDLYMPQEAVAEMKKFLPGFTQDFSYNALLNEIIKKQGLIFSAVMSAHDHYQAYYNNILVESKHRICQITAGGGGGGSHSRKQFQTQSEMGYFIKGHGVTLVKAEIDTPEIKFDTYSVNQPAPILFTNQSPRPLQYYAKEKTLDYPREKARAEKHSLQMLRTALSHALSDYFAFLGINESSQQKTIREKSLGLFSRHGKDGINRAHKLWGYLNMFKQDDFETVLSHTYEILQNSPITPDENSLITYVNKHLEEVFGKGKTLQWFFQPEEASAVVSTPRQGYYGREMF